jgi:hypothetical protein
MWGLWWIKQHWGRLSQSTSVSPDNHHSTSFSIIIITWGWHSRPVGGCSAEWTQLDSTPHYTNLKWGFISKWMRIGSAKNGDMENELFGWFCSVCIDSIAVDGHTEKRESPQI